jgi:hypothetical protein
MNFTFHSCTVNYVYGNQTNVYLIKIRVRIDRQVGYLAFVAFILWLDVAYGTFSPFLTSGFAYFCADLSFLHFAIVFLTVRTENISFIRAKFCLVFTSVNYGRYSVM